MIKLILASLILAPSLSFAVKLVPNGNETFSLQQTTSVTTVKVRAHGRGHLADFFNKVSPQGKPFGFESLSQDFTVECERLSPQNLTCTFAYSNSANTVRQPGEKRSRIILPLHSIPELETAGPLEMILSDKYGNIFFFKINLTELELGLNLN